MVLLNSVRTHLSWMSICARYLSEARRVLRPGELIFASWFRSPPHAPSGDPNRSVFAEADIRGAIDGFDLVQDRNESSPGCHDPWEMLLATRWIEAS